MKAFSPLHPDHSAITKELLEFRDFLSSKQDLDERNDIIPFFKERAQICFMIAAAHGVRADCIAYEYDLFGDFVVDMVVGSKAEERYFFVEFEDAKPGSLFRQSNRSNTVWGTSVSAAFYQIVDWFWKLHDQSHTSDFENRFGTRAPNVTGVILAGRNSYVSDVDRQRLKSSNVFIYTFDDLLTLLNYRFKWFEEITNSED